MTNEQVKETLSKITYPSSCYPVSKEMWEFMTSNYTKVEKYDPKEDHTWYKLYCQGCDAKYTHMMFDPVGMKYRGSSFLEFYGGVVD